MAPGGSGPRPPGTMTWLRGARCTDPEEMPEKEARPPAQNRHGGAPRGERVPLDARRASQSADRRAPKRATTEILRLAALRSPLVGVDGTETSKTRGQQRAAGTKKTALFDIVNRNYAATRSARASACPDCRARFVPSTMAALDDHGRGPDGVGHGSRFCRAGARRRDFRPSPGRRAT